MNDAESKHQSLVPKHLHASSSHANSFNSRNEEPCLAEGSLAHLWMQLAKGPTLAVNYFSSERRCYVVLNDAPRVPATRPRGDRVAILRRLLRGEMQKVVALELGLSPSTVAQRAAAVLSGMGFACSVRRAPVIVVMMASALESRGHNDRFRMKQSYSDSENRRIVSVRRPDSEVPNVLSAAERAIVRLIVEGKSNASIALKRGTSTRTVANQVASVFDKLGVSNRTGLIWRLVSGSEASAG